MYSVEDITKHCGVAAATYARNKNRGGRNNAQGASYEAQFGAMRAAEALAAALEIEDDGKATWLEEQRLCFVDDLIIDAPNGRRLSQLKSGAASWTGGDHPVADDFRLQKKLDEAMGVSASYELVVAEDGQREALEAARPGDIDVGVIRFARTTDTDALFAEHPELVAAIDAISIHEPRPSVRKSVFMTLVGAWVTAGDRISLHDYALMAASAPGPLVATLGPEYELPEAVASHLNAIGMDIVIRKKHLRYRFGGLSGYSEFRAGTPEFTNFERFVVDSKPRNPFEVVAVLRGGV